MLRAFDSLERTHVDTEVKLSRWLIDTDFRSTIRIGGPERWPSIRLGRCRDNLRNESFARVVADRWPTISDSAKQRCFPIFSINCF